MSRWVRRALQAGALTAVAVLATGTAKTPFSPYDIASSSYRGSFDGSVDGAVDSAVESKTSTGFRGITAGPF